MAYLFDNLNRGDYIFIPETAQVHKEFRNKYFKVLSPNPLRILYGGGSINHSGDFIKIDTNNQLTKLVLNLE